MRCGHSLRFAALVGLAVVLTSCIEIAPRIDFEDMARRTAEHIPDGAAVFIRSEVQEGRRGTPAAQAIDHMWATRLISMSGDRFTVYTNETLDRMLRRTEKVLSGEMKPSGKELLSFIPCLEIEVMARISNDSVAVVCIDLYTGAGTASFEIPPRPLLSRLAWSGPETLTLHGTWTRDAERGPLKYILHTDGGSALHYKWDSGGGEQFVGHFVRVRVEIDRRGEHEIVDIDILQ